MVPTPASRRGVAAWGPEVLVALVVAACGGQSSSASPALSPFPSSTTSAVGAEPVGSGAATAPSPSVSSGSLTTPSSAAVTLQDTYEQVVRDVSPSVVLIETPEGLGSGVVLGAKGDIVTNAHVAGTSSAATARPGRSRSRWASCRGRPTHRALTNHPVSRSASASSRSPNGWNPICRL